MKDEPIRNGVNRFDVPNSGHSGWEGRKPRDPPRASGHARPRTREALHQRSTRLHPAPGMNWLSLRKVLGVRALKDQRDRVVKGIGLKEGLDQSEALVDRFRATRSRRLKTHSTRTEAMHDSLSHVVSDSLQHPPVLVHVAEFSRSHLKVGLGNNLTRVIQQGGKDRPCVPTRPKATSQLTR